MDGLKSSEYSELSSSSIGFARARLAEGFSGFTEGFWDGEESDDLFDFWSSILFVDFASLF